MIADYFGVIESRITKNDLILCLGMGGGNQQSDTKQHSWYVSRFHSKLHSSTE